MSILSGYKKVKNYIETGSGKKLLSRWTSSNTVEFEDGKTAQTKVGAIKGITTSTSATETGYAADATTVAALNQSLGNLANGTITIKNDIMGTMIGKICFIYYKHTAGGVVKNKEYFLENVTNLGLSLPLMSTDGKAFPILTSPMFMVNGGWDTPNSAIAALQLKADGTLSWVSSHGHTEPLTYMGFIAYIAK